MVKGKQRSIEPETKPKIVSALSFLILIALFAVLAFTVGKPLLQFVSRPEEFRGWVSSHGALGPLALLGIQVLQVVVAVIPGEVVEIGAGYAFGAVPGTLICLLGAAAGSVVIYAFTRKFGIQMVEAFVPREKIQSMKILQNTSRLSFLVFLLFFIPGTPKDVITYFIGLTPMRLPAFLLISSVARIPSVISSAMGGDALGSQNYGFAVLVFIITAAISGLGVLIYHKIMKRGNHGGREKMEEPKC